eukprot:COSAG02_NODE_6757_length_3380_cov_2.497105_3_plen_216_part_00
MTRGHYHTRCQADIWTAENLFEIAAHQPARGQLHEELKQREEWTRKIGDGTVSVALISPTRSLATAMEQMENLYKQWSAVGVKFVAISRASKDKVAGQVAGQVADKAADKVADKVVGQVADQVADKVADEVADKVAGQWQRQREGGSSKDKVRRYVPAGGPRRIPGDSIAAGGSNSISGRDSAAAILDSSLHARCEDQTLLCTPCFWLFLRIDIA